MEKKWYLIFMSNGSEWRTSSHKMTVANGIYEFDEGMFSVNNVNVILKFEKEADMIRYKREIGRAKESEIDDIIRR